MDLFQFQKLGFIIVPGNPGIGEYYEVFGSELTKLYSRSIYEIIAYRGFSNKIPDKKYSIYEEKVYIQSIIESIIRDSNNEGRNWVVIGHSIGGWIVLSILNEWKSQSNVLYSKVVSGILLFPFLSLDTNSIQQARLQKKLNNPTWVHLVILFYKLIKHLPKFLIQFAFKVFAPNTEKWAKYINYFYFIKMDHIPASILYLAKTEFETLPKDITQGNELSMIKNCKEIIYLFYTNQDIWAPLSHRNEILDYMGEEFAYQIITDENLNHDFCVRINQSAKLAKKIYDTLKTFSLDPQP